MSGAISSVEALLLHHKGLNQVVLKFLFCSAALAVDGDVGCHLTQHPIVLPVEVVHQPIDEMLDRAREVIQLAIDRARFSGGKLGVLRRVQFDWLLITISLCLNYSLCSVCCALSFQFAGTIKNSRSNILFVKGSSVASCSQSLSRVGSYFVVCLSVPLLPMSFLMAKTRS